MKRRGFLATLVGALASAKLLGKKVVDDNPEVVRRVEESLRKPPKITRKRTYTTFTFAL